MKRLLIAALVLTLVSFALAFPAMAQSTGDLITLNDATPAIDVAITLPSDTTGTVALDFTGAAVRLTNADGTILFEAADARLHGLELNIAPNSGAHTLTIERLPGVTQAVVRVSSLPELTLHPFTSLVTGFTLALNQEISLPLSADHPGDTVSLTIPPEAAGVVTANFPGMAATTQLVDGSGVVVAQSSGGTVDGLSLVMDPGTYQFTLLGTSISGSTMVGIKLVSATDAGMTLLQSPEAATVVTNASAPSVNAVNAEPCIAAIAVSAGNLRSGPGTGYSILGYAFRGQVFSVGGHNPEDNWLVISTDAGSAWISRGNVVTQGACDALTTFNLPLQEAQPLPLVITSGQNGEHENEAEEHSGQFEGGEHESEHDD
jgi:hypothetical protein